MGKPSKIIPRMSTLSVIAILSCTLAPVSYASQPDIIVTDFNAKNLAGWQEKSFKGNTQYELVKSDPGVVIRAVSNASASVLYREMKIDLIKTPCLLWSWRVSGILDGLDEGTKGGDDYPARIYVVFSSGMFFWQTRALNYVWSNERPIGSAWPNAYTDKSINVAVQSGAAKVGQWVSQSRNIRNDYQQLIGEDIKQADGIAIMTDTDNSGRAVSAFYGEIRFSASCKAPLTKKSD